MSDVVSFGDIVEKNGKTIRENNLEIQHKIPLGALVEVEVEIYSPGWSTSEDLPAEDLRRSEVNLKGACRLYVVSHTRDCDGSPLYTVSDLPVVYDYSQQTYYSKSALLHRSVAKVLESGYSEEGLKPTGHQITLCQNMKEFFAI